MASFNKFNSFAEAVFEGAHNFASDTFKIMLTNTAPIASNSVLADLTEITAENGYTAGGTAVTVSTSSQTSGTYTAVLSGDVVFTASGGTFGPARYAVIYNDSATNDELVGWWDYGSSFTPSDPETFTIASDGVSLITMS